MHIYIQIFWSESWQRTFSFYHSHLGKDLLRGDPRYRKGKQFRCRIGEAWRLRSVRFPEKNRFDFVLYCVEHIVSKFFYSLQRPFLACHQGE